MSSGKIKTGESLEKGKSAMHKQTAELIGRIAQNLPDMDGDIMQGWINNPRGLQGALRLALCQPKAGSVPKEETPLDTIIRVDRTIRPAYPSWATEVMHPELETVGPAEYDLAKRINLWFHNAQIVEGRSMGTVIYGFLKATDGLKTCLGLHGAVEIQQKGIVVFRKLFGGRAVFCWKSVVRDRDGSLLVPYVYDDGVSVVVRWRWLGHDWVSDGPAARFVS